MHQVSISLTNHVEYTKILLLTLVLYSMLKKKLGNSVCSLTLLQKT